MTDAEVAQITDNPYKAVFHSPADRLKLPAARQIFQFWQQTPR